MKSLLTVIALLILATGCTVAKPAGLLIVNHSGQDIRDVIITSGSVQDARTLRMGVLRSNGYFFISGGSPDIGEQASAMWISADDRKHSEELETKVPKGFPGYVTFEFVGGAWRVSLLDKARVDQFMRPARDR